MNTRRQYTSGKGRAAERALRGLALGRKAWLFAGSDRGADRAAVMYTLIGTAKLNEIDPQAWLADVLARIADIPQSRLADRNRCSQATALSCAGAYAQGSRWSSWFCG